MKIRTTAFAALLFLAAGAATAANNQFELTISEHRFQPEEIVIPAGVKVKLIVHNKDNNYEEFHSDDLHREKIIAPNKSGIVHIGPLTPGTYGFMGEFHADTAQGRVIVR
jgi:hypothetical protein